jgi:uncharacterized protein (TIGR02001 family)
MNKFSYLSLFLCLLWVHPMQSIAEEAGAATAVDSPQEEAPKKGFSFLVTLTTDYIWRGVSQTHRDPALQPEIDFDWPLGEYTAINAGVWASNVKYPGYPDANPEIETWIDLTHQLGRGFSLTLEALRYDYLHESGLSYPEVSGILAWESDSMPLQPKLVLTQAWSWDTYGEGTDSHYTHLGLSLSLPQSFGLAASYGYSRFAGEVTDQNYADWKLALTKEVLGDDLELGYYDSTASQYGRDGEGHWVMSLTHYF